MWVWLSLLLGVCVEATSNGVAMTCDVHAKLGTADRKLDKTLIMSWVTSPAWAGEQYTLRTADPSDATDPKGYVPGQWMNIYIRTTNQDQQFTGLILYAVNKADVKVGQWQVPFNVPYHTMDNDKCVVHSNADPKHYLSTFKFMGPPVGTGDITIKALIKFGLAFPSSTSSFFWPNSEFIVLKEQPQTIARAWYEGEVGESCIDVCRKRNLGCDLKTMQTQGNSSDLLKKVAAFSNCSGIVAPGCSAYSPSVGTAGCFYHSDDCTQPPVQAAWSRRDICVGLPDWIPGTSTCNTYSCWKYKVGKWCCNYNDANPDSFPQAGSYDYGGWGFQKMGGRRGDCPPAAGWPADKGTVMLPTRTIRSASAITCEAVKKSVLDGQRICACSTDGQRFAAAASRAELPLVVAVVLVAIASF